MIFRICIALVAFTSVVACTTQSARRTTDINHIKAINEEAEFRNIDVIWINPPPVKRDNTIKMTIKADPDAEANTTAEEDGETGD